MAKLSQIMGKKIRKEIPFYYQDIEGNMIEDKIIIYSPTTNQLSAIKDSYANKENFTDEDFFYYLLKEITDLDVDMKREEFVEFMSFYSDVFEAVKLELEDIMHDITFTGIDKLEKLHSMPEKKRIKLLALNPELRQMYTENLKYLGFLENLSNSETLENSEEEVEELSEEEIKEREEFERLKAKFENKDK